jgi:hypothetical protein
MLRMATKLIGNREREPASLVISTRKMTNHLRAEGTS